MERKGGFDYILLETTGLADPGPIAGNFWMNEEYASGEMEREGSGGGRGKGLGGEMYLDGVVVVVDAVFGEKVRSFAFFLSERRGIDEGLGFL